MGAIKRKRESSPQQQVYVKAEIIAEDLCASDSQCVTAFENVSKECTKCGKANSISAKTCTKCGPEGPSLPDKLKQTPNAFAKMICGVWLGFLRRQTRNFLVVDDINGYAVSHFLVMPTFAWIKDWTVLLSDCHAGAWLVEEMKNFALEVVEKDFWGKPELRDYWSEWNWKDFKAKVVDLMTFQVPPSQCQLHLQVLLPPLLAEYSRSDRWNVQVPRRYPIRFVQKVLEKVGEASGSFQVERFLAGTGHGEGHTFINTEESFLKLMDHLATEFEVPTLQETHSRWKALILQKPEKADAMIGEEALVASHQKVEEQKYKTPQQTRQYGNANWVEMVRKMQSNSQF